MNLKHCVLSFLNRAQSLMERKICDITEMDICQTGYKKGNEPPKDGWSKYDATNRFLTGNDAHFWFRASFSTPSVAENEYLILRSDHLWEGVYQAQGLLYLNGKMTAGLDWAHKDTYLEPNTEYNMHYYYYMTSCPKGAACCNLSVYAVNRELEQLYYDIKIPFEACQMLSENSEDYARMMSVLTDAVNMTDLRDAESDRFLATVREASEFMKTEFYGKLCDPDGKPVVHCIGHTHIDVEWQWARAQTREKIQRSFSTAKTLMDRYPEYRFMLSQPELYRYLKEEAPEKYEELKQLVKDGRWEPEGAMYLESDCNLTSGESLVRQLIFGKRFFREEFGIESKVLFLPDVFGYSAALPQILRKSGVDYFITSKISWNDTNTMPLDMFYWKGIDGTELFTSFITTQDFGGMRGHPGNKRITTYTGNLETTQVKGTWDRFQQKEYTDHVFMTYGFGDGGGGPTKAMLETQRRTEKGIPSLPVTKMDSLISYLETTKRAFDDTCKRTKRTPLWEGELYLEFHRGTYTSNGKTKKSNRDSEFLLGTAEALSVTDLCFGGTYDTDGLNHYWRKVLHNQFHDILPGSSIKAVYDGTEKDYTEIATYGNQVVEEKLSALASRVSANGGVLVYNPTGFERTAVLTQKGYTETDVKVPAFGWTVVQNPAAERKVKLGELTAENPYYRMTLNPLGQIESLFDKRVGREVLTGKGNVLLAFEDYPACYDAWEIEDYYKLKSYEVDTPATVTPIADGTRAGFCVERTYLHSTIKQHIWMYSESSRIDFETELDWHDRHLLLKAMFPVNVHAMNATYDVQFGHVVRPTHANTSWDQAKFETYAHKWADISEHGYGVALLNNGKYGYSTEGNRFSITLLKCATYPNPESDQGYQHFTYSLYPHTDDFRCGGVISESYALNQPLYEKEVSSHAGDLPQTASLVSVDRPNAVITAVKKAENGNDLIVRFYDAYDCKSTVSVTVPDRYTKASLCDLMENELSTLPVNNGTVTVPVSNFEIVTLKFTQA